MELSPEAVAIIMFGGLIIAVVVGYPLAFVLGGIAMFVGIITIGTVPTFSMSMLRIWHMMTNFSMLAVPLFIFMGLMVEKSGTAERLYRGIHMSFGGVRGGLAIGTILMGTILAACVGIIAASVIMLALISLPSMLQRGYDKELICGTICAGGTLGILIPPSIMLVIYGAMASVSVGKLFMAAFGPGLLLSALYIMYILVRCWVNPSLAPAVSGEERAVPLGKKISAMTLGIIPPLFLVLSVLGVIFFGVAAPTEAAAIGAVAATLLAVVFRNLNWQALKEVTLQTMSTTAMALFIGWAAQMFTGIFIRLGAGTVFVDLIVSAPFGGWGALAVTMLIVFILGMLIDFIGIIFIMVPLLAPIATTVGFDPLWFSMMIIINLQMSFLTPPLAFAIFFLKGVLKPEWEITTGHIIRGVIPFVALIMLGLALCTLFPNIILWLPGKMIR